MTIEQIVYDYLSDELSCPVYTELPKSPTSDSFVRFERTSGSETNKIRSCVLAVQSYAPSLLAAAELNETVKEAMDGLIGEESVSHCKLQNDYNFTDTTTKHHRYQAVYEITYFNN